MNLWTRIKTITDRVDSMDAYIITVYMAVLMFVVGLVANYLGF